jgi:septal ring factor EnvC (AmiA/AmiB activator)
LATEHERKTVYADRCATQIQAALAQQAKSSMILKESQNALDQAIADLEAKRAVYNEEKAKRNEENAILDEVITMFKNQVASWSGR